jgi:hypothetical protein
LWFWLLPRNGIVIFQKFFHCFPYLFIPSKGSITLLHKSTISSGGWKSSKSCFPFANSAGSSSVYPSCIYSIKIPALPVHLQCMFASAKATVLVWMTCFLKWNFPSIYTTVYNVFSIFVFFFHDWRRLHKTKGIGSPVCTSIISVVSIWPNFNLNYLFSCKSTCCKSASSSPSGKHLQLLVHYQMNKNLRFGSVVVFRFWSSARWRAYFDLMKSDVSTFIHQDN